MSTETVPVIDDVVEEAIDQPVDAAEPIEPDLPVESSPKVESVPLSALQKERKKRQEIEQELRWHKEQMMQQRAAAPAPEPDESLFEAATKEDLGKVRQQVMRDVQESAWIKSNPEKAAEINEKLAEFLKQRPNLASAIESASNRYEEAWMLMDALTPKQKIALKAATTVRKDAPGNPAVVPKAAAMNQAVDVMSMSDTEFNAWRQSQRKRR